MDTEFPPATPVYATRPGSRFPLGATPSRDGVNFCIFSRHARPPNERIEAAVAEVRPAVETLHKFCQVAMMTLSACVLSACPKVS